MEKYLHRGVSLQSRPSTSFNNDDGSAFNAKEMVVEENRTPVHSEPYEDTTPAVPRIPPMIALSARVFNERITVKFSRNRYEISDKPTYTSVTTINNVQTTSKEIGPGNNYSDTENYPADYDSSGHEEDTSSSYDSEAMSPRTPPMFGISSPSSSSGSEENSRPQIVFECDYCDKTYREKKRLVKHRRKRHIIRSNYSCKLCPKVYNNRPAWNYHMEAKHKKKKQFTCEDCEKQFVTKARLAKHIKNKHKTQQPVHQPQSLLQSLPPHICHFCLAVFPDQDQLRSHKEIHRTFKCNFCSEKGFFRKHRLQRHLDLKHPSKTLEDNDSCKKDQSMTYVEKEPMSDDPSTPIEKEPIYEFPPTPEEEQEEEIKPEVCKYCEKKFPTKADLQRHWKVTGENLFICGKCFLVCEDAISFSHHLLKHSEKNIFVCTLCSKTFATMDLLEDHFTTHDDLEI